MNQDSRSSGLETKYEQGLDNNQERTDDRRPLHILSMPTAKVIRGSGVYGE